MNDRFALKDIVVPTLVLWTPLAVLATGLSLLASTLVQQDIRLSANYPQVQIAEDAATAIASGRPAAAVVPSEKIDMAKSLAPYVIAFDDEGQPIASSAWLDGQTPIPPAGALGYAREHGRNQFTWQPARGVRSAAVLIRYGGQPAGFVLAGRSLREAERLIDKLTGIALLGWLASLAASLMAVAIVVWLRMSGRLMSRPGDESSA